IALIWVRTQFSDWSNLDSLGRTSPVPFDETLDRRGAGGRGVRAAQARPARHFPFPRRRYDTFLVEPIEVTPRFVQKCTLRADVVSPIFLPGQAKGPAEVVAGNNDCLPSKAAGLSQRPCTGQCTRVDSWRGARRRWSAPEALRHQGL